MFLLTANIVYLCTLLSPELAFNIKHDHLHFILNCSIFIGNESNLVVNIFIGAANDEDVVNKKGESFPKNPKEQKD